ncbi:MAG: tyrosine-type recombinase/integrase, partial [Lachnospiraceae bacterium]|nr:tyrosine-type recombinase/integrase [Lachnospiraceae bacterium]
PYDLRCDFDDAVLQYNVFTDDKIEHFTPKMLRHTGCTMYAREGMDISVLQYIMGHKSVHTTMKFYNHVTEERVIDTFKEHIEANA